MPDGRGTGAGRFSHVHAVALLVEPWGCAQTSEATQQRAASEKVIIAPHHLHVMQNQKQHFGFWQQRLCLIAGCSIVPELGLRRPVAYHE
jgi:hypothetical protein